MVPEAVADLTKAASDGLSDAQNQLGVLYLSGVPGFMTIDAEKGIYLLRRLLHRATSKRSTICQKQKSSSRI